MLTIKHLQYGVAAIAIGGALGLTASAGAQVIEEDTMNVTVLLESSFDLTENNALHLGMVSVATSGVGGDPDPTVGVDTSGARVNPAGGDTANFFFVVNDLALQEGVYSIANAAPVEDITVEIEADDVVDPTDTNGTLTIVDISLLETTAASDNETANADPSANADTSFTIETTNAGVANFAIGATIQANSATTYADGTYTGSIDVDAHY